MPKILPKFNQNILTKNFVSISKAAKFLQVSPDTLRNWEKEGRLFPSRTHGGARRYSRGELLNLKKEIHPISIRKKGLVSISVTAKSLQVSPDTIRNWDKKGLIESFRSRGGARRFTRGEIVRLQKELGIEVCEQEILSESLKSSHEIHKFTPSWFKITFPIVLIMLILGIGWVLGLYIDPIEKKLDDTSKLVTGIIQSVEALQKGVLGIQTQLTPSPTSSPGTFNTNFANSDKSEVVLASANLPIATPVPTTSNYISTVTNSDGTLTIARSDQTATVSLSLDHANTWSALQVFNKSVEIGTVVMTLGGNVGIGWTSPINKLEVAGAQTIGSEYTGVYTAPANGLIVQGNVGIGISAPSYHLDVNGGARFACGDSSWDSGPTTSCSDIAEVYESDGSVGVSELVALGKQANVVTKSGTAYQKGIIGVYSESPGVLVGGETVLGGSGNLAGNKIPVAIAGRVPVRVSDENGPIQIGDYLTSSSVPGVAMKATKPGPVIGQALEQTDFFSGEPFASTDDHLVNIKIKFGTILVFINVSYADPENFLAALTMDDQGNLIIPKLKAGLISLDPSVVSASGQQLTANSQQLALSTDPNYTPPGPNLASNNNNYIDLSGEIASLEDRIKNLELSIKEQNQEISRLSASAASNPSSGNVGIGATVPLQGTSTASSSAGLIVASAQAAINATSFATAPAVSAGVGTQKTADNFKLTPPDILLATASAVLVNAKITETLSSDKLFTAQDSKISGDLSVFGKTILANTSIAGDLIVDGTLSVNGSSINVIGSPTCSETKTNCGVLYFQNSPLAYQVDFFNGLVTIDKTGNLRAQTLIVAEFKVVANKISGSGKIIAGTKSVDLENPLVKSSSRILITPSSETDLVLAVINKEEGRKFTVSTAQTATKDIIFDWFIVNESPN